MATPVIEDLLPRHPRFASASIAPTAEVTPRVASTDSANSAAPAHARRVRVSCRLKPLPVQAHCDVRDAGPRVEPGAERPRARDRTRVESTRRTQVLLGG